MGEDADPTWLIVMVVGALVCGGIVLMVKSDYRFEQIIESNRDYYPAIDVAPPGSDNNERDAGSR